MGVYEFFITFITLFVAVDIVGVLPVHLGFVASLDVRTRPPSAGVAALWPAGLALASGVPQSQVESQFPRPSFALPALERPRGAA